MKDKELSGEYITKFIKIKTLVIFINYRQHQLMAKGDPLNKGT